MAAMAAKTRAKFRMDYSWARFLSIQKDGESVHPRQSDIYEWSFRKRGIHSRQRGCKKQLLRRGRRFVAHFEPGEIDLELSAKACSMGFEGMVSKSPR